MKLPLGILKPCAHAHAHAHAHTNPSIHPSTIHPRIHLSIHPYLPALCTSGVSYTCLPVPLHVHLAAHPAVLSAIIFGLIVRAPLRLGSASCPTPCTRHPFAVGKAAVACCAWPSHPVCIRRMPLAQSQSRIDLTCDKTMLVHPDHNPVHPTAHLQPLHCCAHRLDCHQRDRTTEAMRPSPVYS